MSTKTETKPQTASAAKDKIDAYVAKVRGQVQDGKAKLDQLEAKAKDKRAQTETDAIARLQTAKQNLDQKIQDLKSTSQVHVARAKADIDADVAAFKASVDEIASRVR